MSENIVHTAVVDDCAGVAGRSDAVCPAFKQTLRDHLEIARLGSVTRWGAWFIEELLVRFRERAAEGPLAGADEQKLAFVLGWLAHRAADRQMKPLFRAAEPESKVFPTDCSIYQDVKVFREVYGAGERAPYSPALTEQPLASPPATAAFRTEELEDLFRAFWQRALLSLHTFIPDKDDVEGWLERLFAARQVFLVDIRRYAEAFAHPDTGKQKRFVDDLNFYDRRDPIIRLARSIQDGAPDASIDLDEAVRAAANGSHYAQALAAGLGYIEAASAFFEMRIAEEEFRQRLHMRKGEMRRD